jgi:hypothetical protein
MKNCAFLMVSVCGIGLLNGYGGPIDAGEKNFRFASERTPFPFAGATRVTLEGFNPTEKDAKSVSLLLDKNEISYSSFGEPRLTTVFYKPFPIKLKRLEIADPSGKDRRIFAVEAPKEMADGLGKNTLQIVVSPATKSEPAGLRLLLINSENKVTQVLELRAITN